MEGVPAGAGLGELAAVVQLLCDAIAGDRSRKSPRIGKLKSALAKLDPSAAPVRRQPLPPELADGERSGGDEQQRRGYCRTARGEMAARIPTAWNRLCGGVVRVLDMRL